MEEKLAKAKAYLGPRQAIAQQSEFRLNRTPILDDWVATFGGKPPVQPPEPQYKPTILDGWMAARLFLKDR
jgi:hypothetical protein